MQTCIDGRTVNFPAAGSIIKLDARRVSEQLQPCEFPEFAPFRFPSYSMQNVTGCVGPACRVEITGRKINYTGDGARVRVQVVFIGDGEPDTTAGGWMYV